MNGTVIFIRRKGIRVQMNTTDMPTGNFAVIRQSDGTTAGIVTLQKVWNANGVVNMNWVGTAPTTLPNIGDAVQSI